MKHPDYEKKESLSVLVHWLRDRGLVGPLLLGPPARRQESQGFTPIPDMPSAAGIDPVTGRKGSAARLLTILTPPLDPNEREMVEKIILALGLSNEDVRFHFMSEAKPRLQESFFSEASFVIIFGDNCLDALDESCLTVQLKPNSLHIVETSQQSYLLVPPLKAMIENPLLKLSAWEALKALKSRLRIKSNLTC